MQSVFPIRTERTYLFGSDIHVGMLAEINVAVSRDAARRALSLLVQKHPLLRATVFWNRSNAAFYHLGVGRPVTIDFCGGDWQVWFSRNNSRSFDLQNGPLLRILVQIGQRETTIVLLGHHILGDGLSYFYLMRDFLRALDCPEPEPPLLPRLIRNARSLPRAARLGIPARLTAARLNRAYKKRGRYYTPADYSALFHAALNLRRPALSCFSFTEAETQRLAWHCRQQGVTFNQAVTAAFLYARQKDGNRCGYLGISCSIRDDLAAHPGQSLGNFVSGISVRAQYRADRDVWYNARQIGALTDKKLRDRRIRLQAVAFLDALDPNLVDSVNFLATAEPVCDATKTLGRLLCGDPYDKGTGISNLGRHRLDYSGFSVTRCLFIPPLFGQTDFIVGVVTVNGRAAFCLRYVGAELDAETAARHFEDAKAALLGQTDDIVRQL